MAAPGPNKKISEGTAVSINYAYSAGNAWVDGGTRTVPYIRASFTGVMTAIPTGVPGKSAGATSVTEKAHVAGWQENVDGFHQGSAWLKGQQVLFVDDLGGRCGQAHSMQYVQSGPFTTHGAVVGEQASNGDAWYWNETNGLRRIPRLPGYEIGVAKGMTFQSEVFGSCRNAAGTASTAFAWDPSTGLTRPFADYVADRRAVVPDGLEFLEVTAVSELGDSFAGVGSLDGQTVGWVVNFICSGSYSDCDCDGVLGINDFVCFQTAFALGQPYADCDGDGQLTIDDFICFQTCYAIC